MDIIIVGCGRVGYTIAKSLTSERDVNLTIIEKNPEAMERAAESIDAMLVRGNGLNANTLIEAGAKQADLIICVTEADEANILCCVTAKRLGVKHTVARVRNTEYTFNLDKFWRGLGLDMIINPEQETAREISRLLRFPSAEEIDIFVGGRVELASFNVSEARDFFLGKSVIEVFAKKQMGVLLATVERDDVPLIPRGDLVFEEDDIIRVLGRPSNLMKFFITIGKQVERVKTAAIIGGSRITYHLINLLHRHSGSTGIKIIEIDRQRCEEIAERFPRCLVINGDGADEEIFNAEVLGYAEAVISLTDTDEENVLIALYSMHAGIRKAISKINRLTPSTVRHIGIGSIVSSQSITSEQILRYVRGLKSASGDDINTVYTVFKSDADRVEAVELTVSQGSRCIDVPLKELPINKGVLVGCVVRNSDITIADGNTVIHPGDAVVIIAKNQNVLELDDILS